MQSFVHPALYLWDKKTAMQKEHQDEQCYFNEPNTSHQFLYKLCKTDLSPSIFYPHILEIGCGERETCSLCRTGLQGNRHRPCSQPRISGPIKKTASGYKGEIQDDGFLQLLGFPLPAHPDTRCH